LGACESVNFTSIGRLGAEGGVTGCDGASSFSEGGLEIAGGGVEGTVGFGSTPSFSDVVQPGIDVIIVNRISSNMNVLLFSIIVSPSLSYMNYYLIILD